MTILCAINKLEHLKVVETSNEVQTALDMAIKSLYKEMRIERGEEDEKK